MRYAKNAKSSTNMYQCLNAINNSNTVPAENDQHNDEDDQDDHEHQETTRRPPGDRQAKLDIARKFSHVLFPREFRVSVVKVDVARDLGQGGQG